MAAGAIKAAAGDAILTFLWVFTVSTLGALTTAVATVIGVQGKLTLLITVAILAVFFFVFNLVGAALGGASFNPTGTTAFYAAGFGTQSLYTMALRFPAQAAGAVAGAIAIKEVMPIQYKHMLGGPSLKVDVHTGAIAEGVLTFFISLIVLIVVIKVRGALLFKTWLLAMATVALVIAGSAYTGPSMNPANAFGWAYINNKHNTWEHFYVYWILPFIGATMAAVVFRVLFPPPNKQKKAKKFFHCLDFSLSNCETLLLATQIAICFSPDADCHLTYRCINVSFYVKFGTSYKSIHTSEPCPLKPPDIVEKRSHSSSSIFIGKSGQSSSSTPNLEMQVEDPQSSFRRTSSSSVACIILRIKF
ncbi:Aquaporin SIP1-2 [Dionaea muscipula]